MRWGFAAAAIALPACSLFVDLSDLSDGGAGLGDGGDAALVDGANDAADGQTTIDAGNGDAGDGSTLGFCASHPGVTFCSDFDESDDPDAVPAPWTDYEGLDDGGTDLELDDAEVKSPPHSLYAHTHGGGDGTDLYAKLGPFTSGAHLEADIYIDAKPTAGAIAPLSIAAELSPNDHYALLYLSADDVYLQGGDSTGATDIIAQRHTPLDAGWHHVTIDLKINDTSTTATVVVLEVAGTS